jgi:hypothetical protein
MNVGMSKAELNLKTIVCDESEDENVEIFYPVTNIRDYSDGENVQNLDNLECMKHNNNLDELMNDIAMNFLDIPEILKTYIITLICRYILIVRSLLKYQPFLNCIT